MVKWLAILILSENLQDGSLVKVQYNYQIKDLLKLTKIYDLKS